MIKRTLPLTAILLLSLLIAAATTQETPTVQTGFLFKSITVNDRSYDYIVYVPRDYARHTSGADANSGGEAGWPFILFLHGMGESGTDGQRQMLVGLGPPLVDKAERWPFIVLMPQKPVATDQWEDHADAVSAMLERTLADYDIDESRQYLTGLSQGGHGTWMFNALFPDRFAAIAPICGYGEVPPESYPMPRTWRTDSESPVAKQIIEAAAGVPVWAFHGEADPVVPASQTTFLVEQIKAAGGEARATLYPEVNHNSWDKAYAEDLPAWFLSHRRGG